MQLIPKIEDAKYLRFSVELSEYKNDICINLSYSETNSKYFPHIEAREDLSIVRKYFPDGMKSAGTACDEIRYLLDVNRRNAAQRIGKVKMKDLAWKYTGGTPSKFSALGLADMVSSASAVIDLKCPKYASISSNATAVADKSIYRAGAHIGIYDSAFNDAASFIASLTEDDVIYYPLAVPIVTEIEETDFNTDYKVWNGGTEQMIADGPSSALRADITYGFNATGLLKQIKAALVTAGLL